MTELVTLPSNDGNPFTKKPAASAARHAREIMAILAKEADLSSTTTCRRTMYVMDHGSKEIKEAMLNEQVSVWFAYRYVKRKQWEEHGAKFRALIQQMIKAEAAPQRGCQQESATATEVKP